MKEKLQRLCCFNYRTKLVWHGRQVKLWHLLVQDSIHIHQISIDARGKLASKVTVEVNLKCFRCYMKADVVWIHPQVSLFNTIVKMEVGDRERS